MHHWKLASTSDHRSHSGRLTVPLYGFRQNRYDRHTDSWMEYIGEEIRSMAYDLVIRGGEVVDPGSNRQGRFDVAVQDGRIAAVQPEISDDAAETVDATGQVVTPGLIDLHTHVYWGATYWGIEADPLCSQSGVTTSVDAGSSGVYNWPAFRRFLIEPSGSRIFAFLNISSIGLTAQTYELSNPGYLDVDLAVRTVETNPDLIIGIKARVDKNTTGSLGLKGLEKAREAADRVNLPMMVHIGAEPPGIGDILPLMRSGDILTHCFRGHRGGQSTTILANDEIRDDVLAARERGVLFDIGHGSGSFDYATAEKVLADNLLPDVISSDIHQRSMRGPVYDMPTTLSKFLNLGLTLPQVIEQSTFAPARAIGKEKELGTLAEGSLADIALFELQEGDFTFHDSSWNERPGTQRLHNTRTIVGGKTLKYPGDPRPVVWAENW